MTDTFEQNNYLKRAWLTTLQPEQRKENRIDKQEDHGMHATTIKQELTWWHKYTSIQAYEELNRKEKQKTIPLSLINKDYLKINIFSSYECKREINECFPWAVSEQLQFEQFVGVSKLVHFQNGYGEHFAPWSQWLLCFARDHLVLPSLGSLIDISLSLA